MDTAHVSRTWLSRFFEVRLPAVYLVLGVVWVLFAVVPWIDPDFVGGPGRAVGLSILGALAGLYVFTGAVLTLVMRRRGVWSVGAAPHPQESDPRLR